MSRAPGCCFAHSGLVLCLPVRKPVRVKLGYQLASVRVKVRLRTQAHTRAPSPRQNQPFMHMFYCPEPCALRAAGGRPNAAPHSPPGAAQPAAPAPDLALAPVAAPALARRVGGDYRAQASVDAVASMYVGLDTACPAGGFFASSDLWRQLHGILATVGYQVGPSARCRLLPCGRCVRETVVRRRSTSTAQLKLLLSCSGLLLEQLRQLMYRVVLPFTHVISANGCTLMR